MLCCSRRSSRGDAGAIPGCDPRRIRLQRRQLRSVPRRPHELLSLQHGEGHCQAGNTFAAFGSCATWAATLGECLWHRASAPLSKVRQNRLSSCFAACRRGTHMCRQVRGPPVSLAMATRRPAAAALAGMTAAALPPPPRRSRSSSRRLRPLQYSTLNGFLAHAACCGNADVELGQARSSRQCSSHQGRLQLDAEQAIRGSR